MFLYPNVLAFINLKSHIHSNFIFITVKHFHSRLPLQAPVPHRVRYVLAQKARNWFDSHKIKGFYSSIDDITFENGVRALMQTSGIGKLRPNILLMGYKKDWRTCETPDLAMYFNIMQ